MEALLLWKRYCCESVIVVKALLLSKSYCCGSVTVVEALLLWKRYCCESVIVVEELLLWKRYCCGSVIILQCLRKRLINTKQHTSNNYYVKITRLCFCERLGFKFAL